MEKIQSYLQSLLGIDTNTSATIIIALIVFILGFGFTELSKSVSRFRSRRTVRQLFFYLLESLTIQIMKQVGAYEKTAMQFKFKSEKNFTITRATLAQVSKIDIGYQETFVAFFKGIENFI
ncbi:MAG: hypothetical protein IH947_08740, partial [Bacteroidetes bacterium]|nr:hypothetical protein [Bacteroidota bacterium]